MFPPPDGSAPPHPVNLPSKREAAHFPDRFFSLFCPVPVYTDSSFPSAVQTTSEAPHRSPPDIRRADRLSLFYSNSPRPACQRSGYWAGRRQFLLSAADFVR